MKKLKLIYISIFITFFTLTSCENEEILVKKSNTTQSLSVRTALNELQGHFDVNGALRSQNNPIRNILFDYCFDFEYPVTFSYNTGATVTVTNFDGLVDVLVGMTNALYIEGIEFPFNVITFEQGSVVVVTISNEAEFEALINSCAFEEEDCICTEEVYPVCVEINGMNGESFIMQFPNMCYAQCEGFTENDIVECDAVVDPGTGGYNCFEFIYPISIRSYDGSIVVIASDQEWESAMYTMNGGFDFVYTFSVNVLETNTIEVISNTEEFVSLLNSCYDTINPCNCSTDYNPVCVEENGEIFEFFNFCLAQCEGFTQANIVNCVGCWEFIYPISFMSNGSEITVSDRNLFEVLFNPQTDTLIYPFDVIIDGETSTISSPNGFWGIGEWANMCD